MGIDIFEKLIVGIELDMDKIPWAQILSEGDFLVMNLKISYPMSMFEGERQEADKRDKQMELLNKWLQEKDSGRQKLFVSRTRGPKEKSKFHLNFFLDTEHQTANKVKYDLGEFQKILASLDVALFKKVLQVLNQDAVGPQVYASYKID